MPYVSCRYAPPTPPDMPQLLGDARQVVCLDTEGREWWLTEDSDVGDYKLFIENGGTIDPHTAEEPADDNDPE